MKTAIMRLIIFFSFVFSNFFPVHGQDLDSSYQQIVSDFITCLKSKNKEKIAAKINFPFSREYPIPEIGGEQEFLARYNEVFDEDLTKRIINSQPSTDWSPMGWRGIMFLSGLVWLDDEGKLIAVNYKTAIEERKWNELVRIEKNNLYKPLRNFKSPICIMETPKYRIRIDDLGDGNYRYCSWSLKSKMSDRPELIIDKGKYIPEDSGGDHRYEFKNGEYTYDCSMIVIGEENSPPAKLTIYKDRKIILSQDATSLKD